ncbi:MAG: VacJ [Betaproteobacteria bacterium]|nr:VacJ [Betaproteobacteria bacterium]
MLNRGVLIVRPKQPYLDWVAGLDDSGLEPDVDGEKTIYLIPSFEDDDEAWEILEDFYAEVFERELLAWHTDEAAWPPNRTFAMFKEWFDIELHSVVEDLSSDEIIDDED